MRRQIIILGLATVVMFQASHAFAGLEAIKAFFHRVCVDTKRNNAWPEPFNCIDRHSVNKPLTMMAEKGWQLQNTITDQLFHAETQTLTRAGELKVRWILTQMPVRRRSVFVMRGSTPAITEARLKAVEQVAGTVVGDLSSTVIAVTDTIPRGASADYYERVSSGYESSAPAPRLPEMDSGEGD